jgi:hypothetical protein
MTGCNFVESFAVPGSSRLLWFEREASGRLVKLWSDQRIYLAGREERTFGDGLAHVREVVLRNSLFRYVRTASDSWIEEYLFDDDGRPLRIDGVTIERDERLRVTACHGEAGVWRYSYTGNDLAAITTPRISRTIGRGEEGRPSSLRESSTTLFFRYDAGGARNGVPALPPNRHRDEQGRLWTITGANGQVETTFLWDGFACLGRIDGDLGAPLAACFSLDPTCTPVRVITRDGMTRIPRDAFGESLLAHRNVPGLYGGAIHGGFVHLRSRVIDPFSGSFDRKDPWSGEPGDPRRADGYGGALVIETPPCGPYAVGQYDATGRADPTGEQSFAVILSDLTWSLQHNLGGWFGLDMTVGLATDLVASFVQIFTKAFGHDDSELFLKRYFDYELLHNDRTGISGIRRGFFGNAGAFTYQHMVVSRHEEFEKLDQISVIDPAGTFDATLYNTIIRVDPSGADPLLLAGNADPALIGWTRSGGTAVAIAPGSPMPRFPSGGLHLDIIQLLKGPLSCAMTELVPVDRPLLGTMSSSALAFSVPTAAGFSAGDLVALSDGSGAVEIKTVFAVDGTALRLLEPSTALTPPIRLRRIGPPPAAPVFETLSVPATTTTRLAPAGAAVPVQPYQAGDILRLTQNAAVAGFATATALEIALTLDGPAFAAIDDVRGAIADPAISTATLAGDILTANNAGETLPDIGRDLVLTNGGGITAGAHVNAGATATERKLDRNDLAPLAGLVQWSHLNAGPSISTSATTVASTLTLVAATLQMPPAAGLLILRDMVSGATTARNVTALVYAAVVLAAVPPGNPAASYSVERFAIAAGAPDFPNLTARLEARIALPPGAALAGRALQLVPLPGAALAPSGTPLAATVPSGASIPIPAANAGNVVPSQVVIIDNGATSELGVAGALRATLTLDRPVNIAAGVEASVVPLLPAGPAYDANVINATTVVVQPAIGTGATIVQMPRFETGNLVMLTQGANVTLCSVQSVTGARLTLTGGPAAPVPAVGAATVQLFVPVTPSPANGTWRIGRNGSSVAVVTNSISVDIWNSGHVPNNANVAIVQGVAPAQPAVIMAVASFALDLVKAPALAGTINVTTFPAAGVFYASGFTINNGELRLNNVAGALPAATTLLAIVPYDAPPAPATTVTAPQAAMSGGTAFVPEEDKYEITRRKTLSFHELTHTRQSAELGPLFLAWTPIFILKILAERKNNPDLPEWSPFVSAQFTIPNGQFLVVLSNAAALTLATGDKVELSSSSLPAFDTTLGAESGGGFRVDPPGGTLPGPVYLRKQLRPGAGWAETLYTYGNILSVGGALGYATGTTWGQLIRWIGDLWYWFKHRIIGSGDSFPGTLQATSLTMTTDEGKNAVQGFRSLFVMKDGKTELVPVTAIDEAALTLGKSTGFADGEVTVRPYEAVDRIDGLEYFDAAVENLTFPARVTLFPKNGKTLELAPLTRVSVAVGLRSLRTNVTAVQPDGRVDLDAIPPTSGPSNALRIARVGQGDAVDGPETKHLTELGAGWMRWLFDPYAQLEYTVKPPRGTWYGEIAHYAPFAFSSRSFGVVPVPGWLFWDDFFTAWFKWFGTGAHTSRMEQAASEESAELYSSLAKINGGFIQKTFAKPDAVVGDLARYWYTSIWSTIRVDDPQGSSPAVIRLNSSPAIAAGQYDNPGTTSALPPGNLSSMPAVSDWLRAVPTIGAETDAPGGAFTPLNMSATATDANPGWFLPDLFFPKQASGNPHAVTSWTPPPAGAPAASVPAGFNPGPRGLIPRSPALELVLGMYAGFGGAGRHRITVDDGIFIAADSREAHEKKRQTILFDVNVVDVGVSVAGTPVPAVTPSATAPAALPAVTLLVTQTAAVSITVPQNDPAFPIAGTWAVTAANPGSVVTTADGPVLTAGTTTGTSDFVELSRRYAQANGSYADGVLSTHGMNLPADVHVPVRLFTVTVTNVVPMSSIAAPGGAPLATILPGQTGFVIVPANVVMALALTGINYAPGLPERAAEPIPVIGIQAAQPALAAILSGGKLFSVNFPANDPPEDPAPMVFTTMVGTMGAAVAVTTNVTLQPNFILNGPSLAAAPGNPLTLSDGATQIGPASVAVRDGDATGISFDVNGTVITVNIAAGAPPGFRRIIATDATNPTRSATRTIKVT